MEHWAIAALMGFVIVVATILGSSDHPGRGLTAAIAVGGSVVYPALEDGRVLEVSNVIWCTGFEPNFDWIDVPVEMRNGLPVQDRGVVESCPGLYFMGLLFQYSLSSALIGGVGRDAEYIVHHIVSTTESRVDDLAGSAR